MKRRTDPSGFTFIELLVVLIIISLVSAFVGPRVVAPLTGLHINTTAREIVAALRYNRSRAVSEKVVRVAVFDLDSRQVRTFSTPAASVYAPDEQMILPPADRVYALPGGIRFLHAASGESTIKTGGFSLIFFPNGSSTGGEIVLAGDSGRRLGIRVDAITGLAQVAELKEQG